MKKAIVLFTVLTLLFCSCTSAQNSNLSKPEVSDNNAKTASAQNSKPASQTDKPISEQDKVKDSLFNISDLKICDVGAAGANLQTWQKRFFTQLYIHSPALTKAAAKTKNAP